MCVVFPPLSASIYDLLPRRKLRNLPDLNFVGKILNCELISPAGAAMSLFGEAVPLCGSAVGEFDFGLS